MTVSNLQNMLSTVALIKSPKEEASQITEGEVREMVREAVTLSGGLNFIKDGQFVVIKPNLVSTRPHPGPFKPGLMGFTNAHNPKTQIPEFANGITSDRRVVKAMVELVREQNPSGKVYIMECSGDGMTSKHLKQMGFTLENLPGVDKIIPIGEDGDYGNLDSDDVVPVKVKNQLYDKLPKKMNNRYYFDKTYYSADVIISMCCLKNHANATMTGGIKNVGIGARPACIYSPSKKTSLSIMKINHFGVNIHNFIHDYYSVKPVDFVLTDGIQGLSYGPAALGAPSYKAAKMNMRLILAGKDPVAVDTIHSCIIGVDPEEVGHLKSLAEDGFGTMDTSSIEVVGNTSVDKVRKKFPFPTGFTGGILSIGTKDIKKKLPGDCTASSLSVEDVSINKGRLKAKIYANDELSKIEILIDGKKEDVITENFEQIDLKVSDGDHEVAFHAYDRLLRCSVVKKRISA